MKMLGRIDVKSNVKGDICREFHNTSSLDGFSFVFLIVTFLLKNQSNSMLFLVLLLSWKHASIFNLPKISYIYSFLVTRTRFSTRFSLRDEKIRDISSKWNRPENASHALSKQNHQCLERENRFYQPRSCRGIDK